MKLRDVNDARRSINSSTDVESISPAEDTQSQKTLLVETGDVGEVTGSPGGMVDDTGDRHYMDDVRGIQAGCELIREGSIASSNSNNNDDDDVEDDFDIEGANLSVDLASGGTVWNDHKEDSNESPQKSPALRVKLTTEVYNSTNSLMDNADDDVNSSKSTVTSNVNTFPQNVRLKTEVSPSVSQGFGNASDDQQLGLSTVHQLYNASFNDGRFPVFSNSSTSAPTPRTPKKSPGERQSSSVDYRRSERGLSFLFPSFSDHGMSLLDKVRITVARHKNNYFLGWTAEQLARLDPIVRPKVPVTPAVYREY